MGTILEKIMVKTCRWQEANSDLHETRQQQANPKHIYFTYIYMYICDWMQSL